MTRLIPLAGYVVVKRLEGESQTPSGIVLADSAKEKPQKGEVVAVGPGKEDKMPQVQVGQTVLFKKYGPTEVDVDGLELLLLEEDDIFGILE
ncbi:co-chaperone GroES [Patescibacteria group bacterium]|nr:co-chaperone GroES [Patescibacteria group bacterium]